MTDNTIVKWQAKWIRNAGLHMGGWRSPVHPAPFLRKTFIMKKVQLKTRIMISGLGYYELYLNGRKVGDRVLDPCVTHYDKRVLYVSYDVTEYLIEGINVVGVILGNGWYNCHTPEVWHFDKAPWRDYPKLLLQMENAGKCLLISDESWKGTTGPVVFDGLRNGETYDARLELSGWLAPDYDDSAWENAERVKPPGGIYQEQTMPSCKVMPNVAG